QTRFSRDWSSDVCSSDLSKIAGRPHCDHQKEYNYHQPSFLRHSTNLSVSTPAQAASEYTIEPVKCGNTVRFRHCRIVERSIQERSEERRVGKVCRLQRAT